MKKLCISTFALVALVAGSAVAVERPYTAHVSCTYPGGQIPFYACMEQMKLRVDGRASHYQMYQIMGGEFDTQGNELLVPLSESFELRIQNSADGGSTYLEVVITDRSGKTLFQDQAGQYEVIAVKN